MINEKIRLANTSDLDNLEEIYAHSRKFIKSYGSPQWQDNYPSKQLIESDISLRALYVYESNGIIVGCMTVFDYEETYNDIRGSWLSDKPYKVIHRIATHKDYYQKGISSKLITYIFDKLDTFSIRVDTHELNLPMQKMLQKQGFKYCGIILLNKFGDNERLAYQKDK